MLLSLSFVSRLIQLFVPKTITAFDYQFSSATSCVLYVDILPQVANFVSKKLIRRVFFSLHQTRSNFNYLIKLKERNLPPTDRFFFVLSSVILIFNFTPNRQMKPLWTLKGSRKRKMKRNFYSLLTRTKTW